MNDAPHPTHVDDWRQDLAMVLGGVPLYPNVRPRAFHHGLPIAWDDAVARAADLLRESHHPAFVGLHPLTIESLRAIVALAREHRGHLLPRPCLESPLTLTRPITQAATLGHVMACPLVLGVGVKQWPFPVKPSNPSHRFEPLPDTLDLALDLRAAMREPASHHPFMRLLREHASVAVLLSPWCDERVASQWHRLAGDIQGRSRMAVMSLPDPEALNAAGVSAVITWQTGIGVATGGVTFADSRPRACGAWDAMLTQHRPTLAVDCSRLATNFAGLGLTQTQVIRIASEMSPEAAYSFVVPDLAIGTAGQVMRFDGMPLWLCDDPDKAQPDLTRLLLEELLTLSRRRQP